MRHSKELFVFIILYEFVYNMWHLKRKILRKFLQKRKYFEKEVKRDFSSVDAPEMEFFNLCFLCLIWKKVLRTFLSVTENCEDVEKPFWLFWFSCHGVFYGTPRSIWKVAEKIWKDVKLNCWRVFCYFLEPLGIPTCGENIFFHRYFLSKQKMNKSNIFLFLLY